MNTRNPVRHIGNDDDDDGEKNNNDDNNNDCISGPPFHVNHAQLR